MKTSHLFLKFLALIIFFYNCSKDDNSICITFLECQEGIVWIDNSGNTDEIVYIRFINKRNIVFEVFKQLIPSERNCFNNYNISDGWGEINIIEDTVDKLNIIILPPDWELNSVEFIFLKSNETLNLTFSIYDEYGNLIKSTSSILIRSNVDVDELPICANTF